MRNNMMAMAALMALAGSGALAVSDDQRPTDVPVKRKRNLDIEGPEPKLGPPTARDGQIITRQQRRWQERQSKKHR